MQNTKQATNGYTSTTMNGIKVQSEAGALRMQRLERARLCAVLDCPIDSCFTSGEIARDARQEGWHGPWV